MNRKTQKKVDESTLTTLCAVCRGAFLDAKGVRLRRRHQVFFRAFKAISGICLKKTRHG